MYIHICGTYMAAKKQSWKVSESKLRVNELKTEENKQKQTKLKRARMFTIIWPRIIMSPLLHIFLYHQY